MTGPNQDPHAPSAELELARLINLPERADSYFGPSVLDGEGVSAEFIDACRSQVGRIRQTNESTFPRDQQGITYRFFQGESRGHTHNAINPVNNPMNLLRPLVLTSPSNMTHYGIRAGHSGPNNYADSSSKRGWDDNKWEHAYRQGVQAYEELFVSVLEATNQDSFANSLEAVEPALQKINRIVGTEPYARETAAGWLMHASLATLIHPSEHIRPAGRLRALALLSRFTAGELTAGFAPTDGRNSFRTAYSSGVAEFLPLRIPHTLCPPHLRAATEHKKWGWEDEPSMHAIFGELRGADYRTVSNNIQAHPREAVQLALLSLRLHPIEFGVELMRTLPNLARPILEEMFGSRATFYVDNSITNNMTEQVSQGMGTSFDPTADFEGWTGRQLEGLNRDELAQLLGAAIVRLRATEDTIARMVADPTVAATAREGVGSDPRDPDGYYAALGLNPGVLDQYDNAQLKVILDSAHRAMSKLWHPDHAEQGDAADQQERAQRQELLNVARDRLLDSSFRVAYGKRHPGR